MSRSMIIRSTKSTVIQSLSCLNCESSTSRTSSSRERSAATLGRRTKTSQIALSTPQTSRKIALSSGSASVAAMKNQRTEVKHREDALHQPTMRRRLGRQLALHQEGCGGGHRGALSAIRFIFFECPRLTSAFKPPRQDCSWASPQSRHRNVHNPFGIVIFRCNRPWPADVGEPACVSSP